MYHLQQVLQLYLQFWFPIQSLNDWQRTLWDHTHDADRSVTISEDMGTNNTRTEEKQLREKDVIEQTSHEHVAIYE